MVIDGHWGGEFVAVYFSGIVIWDNLLSQNHMGMFMCKHAVVYILHNDPNRYR